jgi:hypothetical protein
MRRGEGSDAGAFGVFAVTVAVVLLSGGASAFAQHAALPATMLALDSPEGRRLLEEADAKADVVPLLEQFVTQSSGNFCGVASGVMVLNAMQVPAPHAKEWGTGHYTQDNLWNDCAKTVLSPVLMPGMTVDQLGELLQCHPAKAQVVHASETNVADFRSVVVKNLSSPGDFVIVNYDRSGLGQETMGHISPIAAYHAKSDKVLLLDVARYKYPPAWADLPALFTAMSTNDFVSAKSRGFVTVAPAVAPSAPSGVKPARNPLRIAIGIGIVLFVLGAAAGAGVQTVRLNRRHRKRLEAGDGRASVN